MRMDEMLSTLVRLGITDERVLTTIGAIDRYKFVPDEYKHLAYEDTPIAIGYGQTISQPYTVARMIELLIQGTEVQRRRGSRVLEIGTGSGWQTSILTRFFQEVYTIEIVPELSRFAQNVISDLRFEIEKIHFKIGDGKEGWGEYSPYNAIICGANADEIPNAWKEQLASGGRIVCPVRGEMKRGTKVQGRKGTEVRWEKFGKYSFVPLV